MKIPFHRFVSHREEYSNVSDVLDGECIKQVSLLEDEFASYIGVNYALATSHGTSALHLAMLALELKRGDKVICSVNSFANVPEVIRHFDAEPIFIDIDEKNYNIDLNLLESYLKNHKSKKLKAVMVNHIAGWSVDLDRLYTMGEIYNVKIVEDASEAMGATYNDMKIGSTGADITCFNFSSHLKKDICTGGMIVSNNEDIIKRAKLIGSHAMQKDEKSLEYVYDVIDIGFDYSMSQLDAAYIRAQIKEQNKNLKRLKEISQKYKSSFKDVKHIITPQNCSKEHPYTLYIVKVDKNRDSFALELKKEGVEVGLHYIPPHFLTYYKNKYSLKINNFPTALTCYQQFMSLPIYPSMSDKEVAFVIKTVKTVSSTRV